MSDPMNRAVERLAQRATTSYYGKYRGVVTDIEDPDDMGRIRARVPAVLGEHACAWALPAAPFAGDGHGYVMLPVVGANVWIEFEAGRLDSPIWCGGWWSQGQRPDPQGPRQRVIVSDRKHRIVIDDEADTLALIHDGGPSITLSGDEIVLSCGLCKIVVGREAISMNEDIIKLGKAGVSLVKNAMSLGTPP